MKSSLAFSNEGNVYRLEEHPVPRTGPDAAEKGEEDRDDSENRTGAEQFRHVHRKPDDGKIWGSRPISRGESDRTLPLSVHPEMVRDLV